jgi:hypothetical protein
MATVSRRALIGATIYTPTGFLVFNAGKTTDNIPEEMLPRLQREGIIAGSSSKDEAKSPAGAANTSGTTATGAAVTPLSDDLDSKTKAELREIADAEGVTYDDGATKAKLLDVLRTHFGTSDAPSE